MWNKKGIRNVKVEAKKYKISLSIDGKSTQVTRDGKNLFNLSNVPDGSSYVIKTETGLNLNKCWVSDVFGVNGSEKLLDTFKPNTTYTMKAKAKVVSRPSTIISHQNATFLLYRSYNSELSGVFQAVLNMPDKETIALNTEKEYITSFTTPADMTNVRFLSYCFYGNNDGSTTGAPQGEIDVSEIMLVEGKYTAENFPDFELYGVSPSPDYPSEIKSIGDDINLFDKNTMVIDGSYVSDASGKFISNATSKRTDYIEIKEKTSYYIYSDKTVGNWGAWYNKDKKFISGITLGGKKEGIAKSPTNAKYMAFTLSYNNNLSDFSNVKIAKSDKEVPYSEYGEGTLSIEQRGKNIINPNISTITNAGVTIKNNGDGSYTATGTSTRGFSIPLTKDLFVLKSGLPYTNSIEILDGDMPNRTSIVSTVINDNGVESFNYMILHSNLLSNTITPNEDKTVKRYELYCNAAGISINFTFRVQLEQNNKATEWQPYFYNSYILPLSEPLRSLPNGVKDTLEVDGIHRRVESIILDGSEDWKGYTKIGNNARAYYIYNRIKKQSQCLSNYFNYSSLFETDETGINLSPYETSLIAIKIPLTKLETKDIQGIKNWLSTHNTEVIYELATETIEPYTDEQKEIINSMVTEKGTNIFNINEDTGIEIQYKGLEEEWDSTDIIPLKIFKELICKIQKYSNKLGIKNNLINEKNNGEFLFSEEVNEIDRLLEVMSNVLLLEYKRKYWYNLTTFNYKDWTKFDEQITLIEEKIKNTDIYVYKDDVIEDQKTYRNLLYKEV
jgi:hypothetical protein